MLRVIASMDPASGGPCQGIRNSIPELQRLGVHSEVVSLDDPKSSFLENDPFPIHALGPSKTSWCYSPKLSSWLEANISGYNIIIVHGLWLYHGYAVRSALIKLKLKNAMGVEFIPKIFIMPHGMLDPYFQKASERKIKAIRNLMYWKIIESRIVNEADGLLFTCEEERRLARIPFSPYQPKREINVGYGIVEPPTLNDKMNKEFRKTCPNLKDSPYFLFLSRIHEKKGVDMLIKAYEKLLAVQLKGKRLDAFPRLVIAGPGLDSNYGRKMKEMVSQSNILSNYVFFTGMLNGDAKWGAFYSSKAFVLPSHQENFGISIVEALACNKPVLISRKVNIWKEIETEKSGFVADDTIEGTAQLLERWDALSEADRQELEQRAGNCYQKHFNIKQIAKQLKEVLA